MSKETVYVITQPAANRLRYCISKVASNRRGCIFSCIENENMELIWPTEELAKTYCGARSLGYTKKTLKNWIQATNQPERVAVFPTEADQGELISRSSLIQLFEECFKSNHDLSLFEPIEDPPPELQFSSTREMLDAFKADPELKKKAFAKSRSKRILP